MILISKMMMSKINAKRRQIGQGLTEYLAITALIAVACFGVVSLAGTAIQSSIARMAAEIAGNDGVATTAQTAANTHSQSAQTKANEIKEMKDYSTKNNAQ